MPSRAANEDQLTSAHRFEDAMVELQQVEGGKVMGAEERSEHGRMDV